MSNLKTRLHRIERARRRFGNCAECGRFPGGVLPEGADTTDPQFNPRDENGELKNRCDTCGTTLRFSFAILERGYLEREGWKQ